MCIRDSYDHVAQCTVAMIVNDLITVGALPITIAMHCASGSSSWFENEDRTQDLIDGWKRACDLSGAAWAGGETPNLKDIIHPEAVVLAGSSAGFIRPKERIISPRIQEGDAIILLESSGIHANGLTLARNIADALGGGYASRLSDGTDYGLGLLVPTIIYLSLIHI